MKAGDSAIQEPEAPWPSYQSVVAENAAQDYAILVAKSSTTLGTTPGTPVIQPIDSNFFQKLKTAYEGGVGGAGDDGDTHAAELGRGNDEHSSREASEVQVKGGTHGSQPSNDSAVADGWWADRSNQWWSVHTWSWKIDYDKTKEYHTW